MERNNYKFKSQNTLEHISFHDCIIKRAIWSNSNLLLYFDWLDIFKMHPNNDTGKAKQSDNALVYFENVNVKATKSQWYDNSKAIAKAYKKIKKSEKQSIVLDYGIEDIEIKDIEFFDAINGLEITVLNIVKNDDIYNCRIDGNGLYQDFQDVHDFYKDVNKHIEFEYSNAYVCFNNLICDAWFEGAYK